MSLNPGSTLGPYTLRAELAHGGMGEERIERGPLSLDDAVDVAKLGRDWRRRTARASCTGTSSLPTC